MKFLRYIIPILAFCFILAAIFMYRNQAEVAEKKPETTTELTQSIENTGENLTESTSSPEPAPSREFTKQISRAAPAESSPGSASKDIPEATTGKVTGRVTGPAGEPVPGCKVIFLRQGTDDAEEFAERGRYHLDEPYAETGEHGRYLAENIEPGAWILAFRAPGYIYRAYETPVNVRAGQTVEGIDQELAKAGAIEGIVVENISAQPIEGAEVFGRVIDSERHEAELYTVHKKIGARSDADGKFRLDSLLPGEKYDLQAEHPDYQPAEEKEVVADNQSNVRLVMSPGSSVSGKVVFEDSGQPAEGASVTLYQGKKKLKSTQSKDEGSFELLGLASGNYRILARKGAYRSEEMKEINVSLSSPTEGVLLTLKSGPVIYGTVKEIETEKPVAGAKIKTADYDDQTLSKKDGSYQLEGVSPVLLKIEVTADNYVRKEDNIAAQPEKEIRKDFLLEPAGDVLVLVTDPEDKPIPGVRVFPIQGMNMATREIPETGQDGRVRIENVSLTSPPVLTAMKAGYEFKLPEQVKFPKDKTEVEVHLVLQPASGGGVFAGTVTDTNGSPIAAAEISWFNPPTDMEGKTKVYSEVDGGYRLSVGSSGPASQIQVSAEGYAPAWKSGPQAGTEEEPTFVDFELEPGHWMELEVVDPEDQPVEGAVAVFLSGQFPPMPIPGLSSEHFITDAEGKIRVETLPGPKVNLYLQKSGWTPIQLKPFEVDQSHRIVMLPSGQIQGKVVEADTETPIANFSVSIRQPGMFNIRSAGISKSYSDPNGEFTYDGLNQGVDLEVSIEAPDYGKKVIKDWQAKSEEDAEIRLVELSRGGELQGRVVNAQSNQPVSGARVVYAIDQGSPMFDWNNLSETNPFLSNVQSMTTGEDGIFSFNESGEERGSLFITAENYQNTKVEPDQRQTEADGLIIIRLESGASLSGQYHIHGMPQANENLLLIKIGESLQGSLLQEFLTRPGDIEMSGRVTTDEEGLYEFENLEAGRYQLTQQFIITGMGLFKLGRRFNLASGEAKKMDLGDNLGYSTLSGQVTGPDGKPVARGAALYLTPLFNWEYTDFSAGCNNTGNYRVENLVDGPYEVHVLSVSLGGSSLYDNRIFRVEVSGNTVKNFTVGEGGAVTATLVFPESYSEQERSGFMLASLIRVGGKSYESTDLATSPTQDGQLTFTGVFQGEYQLRLQNVGGVDTPDIPQTFQIDTSEGNVDLGQIQVPE